MATLKEKQLDYNEYKIYHGLRLQLWMTLSEDVIPPKDFLVDYLEACDEMLKISPNMEVVNDWISITEIKINRQDYKKLATLSSTDFYNVVKTDEYDLQTACFISGIRMIREEVKRILNAMAEGKKAGIYEIPENSDSSSHQNKISIKCLYLVDGLENPMVEINKDDLDDLVTNNYHLLTDFFYAQMENEFVNKDLFIESEYNEFKKLFASDKPAGGWKYLSNRLGTTEQNLDALWNLRYDVIQGTYIATHYNFNTSKRINYGWLLSSLKYIDFLKAPQDKILAQAFNRKNRPIDDRIILIDNKEEDYISACFNLFALDISYMTKGKPMMSEEDVNYFLRSNFTGFGELCKRKKFDPPLKAKKHLVAFVRQVFNFLDAGMRRHEIDKYRAVVVDNFNGFENLKEKTLTDYFSLQLNNFDHNLYRRIKEYQKQYL